MNFDGSYARESGLGGIGGVIRDHLGIVFCTFSWPVHVTNANEVEIYPLLGCRELKAMNGVKAIIEGSSSMAIKWGFKCFAISVEVS